MINRYTLALVAVCALLASCSERSADGDKDYGLIEKPVATSADPISYQNDIKPILDNRCIACHSCYDAPCQLKLTAHEGVIRGASKERVYQHQSIAEGKLSRLFFDAQGEDEWRQEGFSSVVSDNNQGDAADSRKPFSSLLGMLDLKTAEVLKPNTRSVDVPIDDSEAWQCSTSKEEFVDYADDYKQRGMPYGLPAIDDVERSLIQSWLFQGAEDDSNYDLTIKEQELVEFWESLLNKNSKKSQLIARYIYEHLFLASIYFGDDSKDTRELSNITQRRFFQLVRSKTPPGQAIDVIATRRPFDNPGVQRTYYRLRLNRETVVAKTHIPFRLDQQKYLNWQKWFYEPEYKVETLPSYDIETASNPFKTFRDLPADARYRFMLDEASYIVKGFIKGPVCKGQAAVNVINEHFWVFFVDPDYQSGPEMRAYLSAVEDDLDLPAQREDTLNLFGAWDDFAEKERAFLLQRRALIQAKMNQGNAFDESVIWDGEGFNANAALTIYRHFDNATVHQGLSGQTPKTAWIIDYPLLERIHYLLVAGYDVYGNISHNLLSRIYMDFLRMEGESLFLLTLPQADRVKLRRYWYRDADERIEDFLLLSDIPNSREPAMETLGKDPKQAVLDKMRDKLSKVVSSKYEVTNEAYDFPKDLVRVIVNLENQQRAAFSYLPEVSMVEIKAKSRSYYMTILKHAGHLNNTSILFENLALVPEETTISVLPGMVGPRPNAFMVLSIEQIDDFSRALSTMSSEEEYVAFLDEYAVRRTDPNFWPTYDSFHRGFKEFSPVDFGVLDLNKLHNK